MRRTVLLLIASALLAAGCGGEGQDAAAPPAAASSFAPAAKAAVRDVTSGDALLLDVRTDAEHRAGHAPEATHLPLARIQDGARPDVPKDRRIYVYCRTGRRAAVAADLLRKDGFTDVTNIGGLADWKKAGGAVSG